MNTKQEKYKAKQRRVTQKLNKIRKARLQRLQATREANQGAAAPKSKDET